MIEVYPHPAMVSLFGHSYTLKYKAKRGRSVDDRRYAFAALTAHLEKLTISDPPLSVATAPRWDELRDSLVVATSNGQLDLIEDELDAVMCAYIAFYYWTHGASHCRVVGDVDTGYIVTPVTPTIGADLDAVVLETPVRRVRKAGVVPRQSTNAVRLAPARAPQIVPTPAGQCGCGCGAPVRNRYRPGHEHVKAQSSRVAGSRSQLALPDPFDRRAPLTDTSTATYRVGAAQGVKSGSLNSLEEGKF